MVAWNHVETVKKDLVNGGEECHNIGVGITPERKEFLEAVYAILAFYYDKK